MEKRIFWLFFGLICGLTLFLALPTINDNISDPNMIVYFNHDEGQLMDVIWYYYTGTKRDSFQIEADYGLEMRYLADFGRLVLTRFTLITPGLFVLILRWIHLAAWLMSFLALWRLVKRHFMYGWEALLAVSLLAVRPAFAYLCNNLKPEPLVLLLSIFGLDYTLRIIDTPFRRKNLYIAIAFASLAFLVKYAGLFLLPVIVASLFLAKKYNYMKGENTILPEIKISRLFPAIIGLILIALPFSVIFLYVRRSTGLTWYKEFGFADSLAQNKTILYMSIIGVGLILSTAIMIILNRMQLTGAMRKIVLYLNEFNSYSMIVCAIFSLFLAVFGFRWIINPQHFIDIYAQMGVSAAGLRVNSLASGGNILLLLFGKIYSKILMFDPIILILFIFYISVEIFNWRVNLTDERQRLFKRLVLFIFGSLFIIPALLLGNFEQHHMLPFFVAISILAIEGSRIFVISLRKDKRMNQLLTAGIFLLSVLFASDIALNGAKMIYSRMHEFRRYEDVAYAIKKWWIYNIPKTARMVSEHHVHVYIPPGYNNLKTFNAVGSKKIDILRKLVYEYKPDIVYYNERPPEEESMPGLEKILPDLNVRLLKYFEALPGRYERKPCAKFLIYEVK